jgi:hypothetical protein
LISVPIDLEPIKRRVAEQATKATLVGLGAPLVLVKDTGRPGTAVSLPIETKLLKGSALSLAAVLPDPPIAMGNKVIRMARYACIGLAGLLVLIFAASMAIKRTD